MGTSASTTSASPNTKKPILLPHPRVELEKGPVEGLRHQLADGYPVNVFLGIPYAKPPVGELRFRKPVEADPWLPSVLSAKRYRSRSVQMGGLFWDAVDQRVGTSEDCLYLNVIGPGWSNSDQQTERQGGTPAPFPVMMYIHGGAFLFDSAVKYHYKRVARTLVHHGVVVVIIQYRLGLFGYFCTGDECCPGNFGLWDQLMALKWVKGNIAAFGGDPTRITVVGQSAGAAAADLLSISPLSRDLFSQTILMGGNAECSWALAAKEQIVLFCRKWALKLGFKFKMETTVEEGEWGVEQNCKMMDFLRALPADKFVVNTIAAMRALFDNMGTLWLAPVVDGELLPVSPKELRAETPSGGGRKTMVGVCKHEGMLFLALGMRRANAKLLDFFQRLIQTVCSEGIKRLSEGERRRSGVLLNASAVFDLYGINGAMRANKQAIASTCVLLMSDFANNIALHNFCEHSLPGGTVFRFLFEHFNPDNTRALNPLFPLKGATHAAELAFLFDINMFVLPWRRTVADRQVMAMVTKLWTNFAKFGDPNGALQVNQQSFEAASSALLPFRWEPIDQSNVERHLCIAKEPRLAESTGPEGRRIERMAAMYRMNIQ